jgi:adenylate cyclase
MERKLAAILSADVKSYSRLMGEDEAATIRTLTAYREVLATLIPQHRGRVVDAVGDNLLAEFPSVVQAVECAVAIQRELSARNAALPLHRRMEFRIGINLGDVVVEGERIYGDGVNIAARLESLAEAGGICISGSVYEQIATRLALGYEDLGEQAVKNIARPVRVYRVRLEPRPAAPKAIEYEGPSAVESELFLPAQGSAGRSVTRLSWQKGALVLVALLLILGGGVTVWQRAARPPAPASVVSSEKAPALPLPDKPSIAVLPFVNMSGDSEQEYFSDGMTEDLITDLSKLSSLFVIARTSVFTYKGKAVKPEQVSRELGVRYVVEGSVRKAGNRVRITAQLIDATTGYHRWAERYDRELQDIFALQAEIAQKIVGTLAVQLTAGEQARLGRKYTDNLEAYDYFLRGGEYLRRFTAETNAQAREMFEKAIALDPGFALAYALLSVTYERAWGLQWSQDPQTLEQAFALAQKAIALDDTLPAAHIVLGNAYWQKKQSDQAIAEMERAIALDPNEASGYGNLAKILNSVGKPEEALKLLEKAMRLNPYDYEYLHHMGGAYFLTGRFEESIASFRRVLIRNPDFLPTRLVLAVIYTALGWEEEARVEAAEILRINPHFSLEVVRQTVPFKDQEGLERLLDGLRKAGLK